MDINELFKGALKDGEINPPDAVWDKISAKLVQAQSGPNTADSSSYAMASSSKAASAKGMAKVATWKIVSVAAAVATTVAAVVVGVMNTDNNFDIGANIPIEETSILAEVDTADFSEMRNLVVADEGVRLDKNAKETNTVEVSENDDTVTYEPLTTEVENSVDGNYYMPAQELKLKEVYTTEEEQLITESVLAEIVEALPEKIDEIQQSEDQFPLLPQTIDDYSAKLEEKFNALLSPTDKLFIPNLITPNNDGINDCFEIRDIEKFSSVYVAIYSRDKKLIYENKKYDNSWCPTDVPDGVYFCCVKVSDEKYRPAWVTVHIKTK